MPFPYKTVLITGATSGIGQALAERMIASGVFVIAVGRRKERLDDLVKKHGSDKVAAEPFDISDLSALPNWVKHITTTYPKLDSIVLNAGLQKTLLFTKPETIDLAAHSTELTTNYLSPLHLITLFLPHLISLSPQPTSIIVVSSCLSLIPLPAAPTIAQPKPPRTLSSVIEILPPAVKTELHKIQKDLVEQGQGDFGMELDEFADFTWGELEKGDGPDGRDEITVKETREWVEMDHKRRGVFEGYVRGCREGGMKF
ncbi:unnamed protein product [Sordaria macrospora k-hell]|uniref:WGS project CABT00000000 data, contig 2.79 n=1 Tax=Sordaria macrospora (strain ATCC MYA-333 / DSM 997 / K(L3346) / K-hell) TaxID=771870 RepID=F7WBM7_SORMK|nr:uncharacterized protein SMAC_09253 [Sordaria macrospora k-hell]CCC14456.1 unnamed protein product [Sordaria macrospora k-hell]